MQPILTCQRRKKSNDMLKKSSMEIYFVFVDFDISRDLCASTSAEHTYLGSNARELVLLIIISIVNKHQYLKFTH